MTVPLSDVGLLRRPVGFDSTSRNSNLPTADFICDYLDRPGVRIATPQARSAPSMRRRIVIPS